MKSYKWHAILFLLIMVIIQPYIFEWTGIGGVSINFVMYFTMLFAFTKKPGQSFVLAVAVGLVYDMIYSIWIGKMIIVLVLGTALVLIFNKRIYRENIPALSIFFLVSMFLLENINTILETGFIDYINNFVLIQGHLIWIAVYAAALSVLTGALYFLASLKGDRSIRMKGAK